MSAAIPVVPLGDALRPGTAHAREVAMSLGTACETTGFFYLVDHGLPDDLLNAQFALGRALFELPPALGLVTTVTGATPSGEPLHEPVDDEQVLTHYECFSSQAQSSVSSIAPARDLAQTPPWLHAQMDAYARAMVRLSRRLMQLIALSLELPEGSFDADGDSASAVLRLLRYPPCDSGVGAHTDRHALTVLAQDHRAGLEMQTDDGAWVCVPPREGALVVHPGDALARWTGEQYRSPVHRVRRLHAPSEARWSIPFFYSPAALRLN
jgi:isopenicillin N synthase-like dioxygenase